MAVRRLAETQPESFAFTPENQKWAESTIAKYPAGRQASAVIALLWRAQEQEGWVTERAIEHIADRLEMPKIRVLEVATFYTMFHLHPVGTKAHIQVCGTTPCMLRGSEDLIAICKARIASEPHKVSDDGAFSWEEVECLGACVNAPMVQIFKDTYEDLTVESFEALLDGFASGKAPEPGPQIDRQRAAPASGLTSLTEFDGPAATATAEKPKKAVKSKGTKPKPSKKESGTPAAPKDKAAKEKAEKPASAPNAKAAQDRTTGVTKEVEPVLLTEPDAGKPDDLKRISGIGPKIESILHELGIFHFHQIAAWTAEHKAWVDERLKFKGRIDRENWVDQAKALAKEAS